MISMDPSEVSLFPREPLGEPTKVSAERLDDCAKEGSFSKKNKPPRYVCVAEIIEPEMLFDPRRMDAL
jgi:hypothetical protein